MVSEIVEDRLYLGDVIDGENAHEHKNEYDSVISVGGYCHDNTTDCLKMRDNYGVNQEVFRAAADRLQSALCNGEVVFIHCAVGASRAPSVTAAVMAVLDNTSFDEAIEEIREKRGTTRSGHTVNPHPALESAGKKYVGNQS
jgi:hypothetical protein